jgi:hypothetical protein
VIVPGEIATKANSDLRDLGKQLNGRKLEYTMSGLSNQLISAAQRPELPSLGATVME